MEAYYDRRAAEYDDWYLGAGLFAGRERPGWEDELRAVRDVISSLPSTRTLDVACGTGFITRDLPVTSSQPMSAPGCCRSHDGATITRSCERMRSRSPFRSDSFDRVFTGHFYGHLDPEQRARFLAESRRIAPSSSSSMRRSVMTSSRSRSRNAS